MTRSIRRAAMAATMALAVSAGGCATGTWDDVLRGTPGGSAGEVTGTVERVDSRNRTIQVREHYGRTVRIRYDGSTRVVYQGRNHHPTALERGDVVTVRVRRDRNGTLHTSRIVVRQDARDRYGHAKPTVGRRETLSGRVGRISRSDGRFELRTEHRTTWVTLPYRPAASVEQRFRRLRSGDRVRVEGTWMSGGRLELRRFR